MADEKISPAVKAAKNTGSEDQEDKNILTLPSGVRVRINPVSPALIDEVTSYVKLPEVPVFVNEEYDPPREEPNPSDPDYLRAIEDAESERLAASIDALVMFGIDLIDGIPEEDDWIKKLQFLEKRDRIDLSVYDFNDPYELEFAYKRLVAMDGDLITRISGLSGVSKEDVEDAEESFRGDETQ